MVAENLFGTSGAEAADKSEPDLPFAFGLALAVGFAAVVDSVPALTVDSSPSGGTAAPALPEVVEEICPPELSEFISGGDVTEAPASADPADPCPASEPLAGSDEPVVIEPVVSDVVPDVVPDVAPDVDESVDPVSVGSAHATPGVVATATPTPKATARATNTTDVPGVTHHDHLPSGRETAAANPREHRQPRTRGGIK